MHKKGNVVATIGILILVVAVVGTSGYLTDWWGLIEPEPTPTEGAGESKSGELASFKIAVEDNMDNPTRYAGTGYCWNINDPSSLLGGGSITLSATATTSVSAVNIGDTIECVAFDSSHGGIPKRKTVNKEGDQMILQSRNITGTQANFGYTFYEDSTAETPAKITMSAGQTDKFNNLIVELNASDLGFNLGMVCLGSNVSTSEVSEIELGNYASGNIPYRYRNTHDYCFTMTPQFVEDYDEIELGMIKITLTDSAVDDEGINVTLIDFEKYEKVGGGIGEGYEADDSTPDDVGATDPSFSFTINV